MAVGIAALAVYLALTPAVVGDGDSAELTLALAVGGVPHPPGYPLYALLGHGWVTVLHALGMSWARAAGAWSALGAATAVTLVHALAARAIPSAIPLGRGGRAAVALFVTALFALNPAWLHEATSAEVHGWHVALIAGLCVSALSLLRDVARPGEADDRRLGRGVLGLGLLSGAGLAHHLTSVFFILPMAIAVAAALIGARRLRASQLLAFAAGVALAPAAHLFTAWRAWHPAAFQWPLLEPGASSVLAHARGSIFAVFLGHFAPRADQAALLAHAVAPFLVPGLALLVVAIAIARESALRRFFVALLAAATLQLGFVLLYGVPDCVPYFLPALLAAFVGLAAFGGRLAGRIPHPAAATPLALGVLVAGWVWTMSVAADHRRLAGVDAAVHARWRAVPFERGFVLWQSDYYTRLRSYQLLDGEKPDVAVENPAMLTWGPPRRAFQRRFGFDPLEGLALRSDDDLPLIAPNIARQTALPVLDFERWRP
jgi:hypothetical protein